MMKSLMAHFDPTQMKKISLKIRNWRRLIMEKIQRLNVSQADKRVF